LIPENDGFCHKNHTYRGSNVWYPLQIELVPGLNLRRPVPPKLGRMFAQNVGRVLNHFQILVRKYMHFRSNQTHQNKKTKRRWGHGPKTLIGANGLNRGDAECAPRIDKKLDLMSRYEQVNQNSDISDAAETLFTLGSRRFAYENSATAGMITAAHVIHDEDCADVDNDVSYAMFQFAF